MEMGFPYRWTKQECEDWWGVRLSHYEGFWWGVSKVEGFLSGLRLIIVFALLLAFF